MPLDTPHTCTVIWSEEDGEYVGLCAQHPYLSHLDATPELALEGVRQLVRDAEEILRQG